MRVRFRFFVFIFILLLIAAVVCLLTLPVFRAQYVEVHGSDRVNEQTMDDLLAVARDKNVFLADRNALKVEVEKDPYLVYESTWFTFPNRVVVNVEERHPQYYLEHLGNYLAVSSQGIVLSATKEKQVNGIPMITGIQVTAFTIGERVRTEDDVKLIALSRIIEKFEESGMTAEISEVNVNDVVHISMRSVQGYEIQFGTSDSIERKIEWLYSLFRYLEGQNVNRCRIDVSSPENPTYNIG